MSAKEELFHLVDQLGDDEVAEIVAMIHRFLDEEKRRAPNGAVPNIIPGREFFAQPPIDLATLAARQGVGPVTDFDALLGDFWPEDEPAYEFVATIRQWRREGGDA